jgi:hypothetical protein
VHFGNFKLRFNTPGSMPVNLSDSVGSVALEILQVGEKQTGNSACSISSGLHHCQYGFTVRRLGR